MSTQTIHEDATRIPTAATTDRKLEVVIIPVSDVDRAKHFYENLGWRLDADFASGDEWRVVQLTPPGSPCSVMFGKGVHARRAGISSGNVPRGRRHRGGRAQLIGQGVEVSDVFHFEGGLLASGPRDACPARPGRPFLPLLRLIQ